MTFIPFMDIFPPNHFWYLISIQFPNFINILTEVFSFLPCAVAVGGMQLLLNGVKEMSINVIFSFTERLMK